MLLGLQGHSRSSRRLVGWARSWTIWEDGSEKRSTVVAIRLLMLTGCRPSEVRKRKWKHVDLDAGELRLIDIKTGGRAVPLAASAERLLTGLPRDEDNP